MPVQFTPGQLRNTVGLSLETYRHWKRVLPPFIGRKGNTPCFSTGDLLAAGILHRLTDRCGVRVGYLTEISKEIVSFCNASSWAALENCTLHIDLQNASCRFASDRPHSRAVDVAVVCPLNPVMADLRNALLRSQPLSGQGQLRFPPTEVGSSQARRRRA